MTIDHDAIAVRVRQDRKAGTPGKWIADPHDAEADQDRYDTVFADAGIHGASPLAFIPHFWSAHWVDACRIAGLPRLEAAYLDLYDEVVKLRAERDRFEAALEEIADGLKGIAREIQIGPDDEGREIYEMAKALQWDARQALKGQTDE